MSDVKWIQIVTDIFDDEKMCAIESMPDGWSIEIVWFKILCLAGRCNCHGFLIINDKLPYTDEMLSKTFRMDIGIVQRALDVFQSLDMIEVVDNSYMVSNWLAYQSGSLEDLKEKHRIRQKRYRENQKKLKLGLNKDSDVMRDVTGDVSSSISISLSNKKEIKDSNYITEIVNYLNTATGKNFKSTTDKTKRCIQARLGEGFTLDDFKTVIDIKCKQWLKDERMSAYLRPETLFGTKFEGYLNEAPKKKPVPEIPKEEPPQEEVLDIRVGYENLPQEEWTEDEIDDAVSRGIITENEAHDILWG